MEKREAAHGQMVARQTVIETDLKKEMEGLRVSLASARTGSKAESEMYQETLEKFSQQVRTLQSNVLDCIS